MWSSPAEVVTLVKSAYIHNANPAAARAVLGVQHVNPSWTVNLVDEELATGVKLSWEGWLVLNPGDIVYCYADSPDVGFWVSGATLLGPPAFPPASQSLEEFLDQAHITPA